jgi:type IX secretion system PorP/SprF family membrane protein
MKKIILGVSVGLALSTSVMAQDIHSTQYFASPLTLNPALTGLTPADVRVALNYRAQWSSVSPNPYVTGVASFDMGVLKGKLPTGDALGIGLLAIYDKSGLGGLQNMTVGLSLAYHKGFGVDRQQHLSIGMQGNLVQKSLDFNKLKFEDQFDVSNGSTPYTTKEQFSNADLTYPDFNLGILYSGRVSEHATTYVGFSYYHLTQPIETFLQGSHTISSRYSGYLGGSFDMNDNTVLYASGLYQSQASATEVMVGASVGFIMNPGREIDDYHKNTVLYLGAWYRYGDAVSPYIGFEWSKMQLGVSYDVNVSNFSPATGGNGAYELTLIFNGHINRGNFGPHYNYGCPKF